MSRSPLAAVMAKLPMTLPSDGSSGFTQKLATSLDAQVTSPRCRAIPVPDSTFMTLHGPSLKSGFAWPVSVKVNGRSTADVTCAVMGSNSGAGGESPSAQAPSNKLPMSGTIRAHQTSRGARFRDVLSDVCSMRTSWGPRWVTKDVLIRGGAVPAPR